MKHHTFTLGQIPLFLVAVTTLTASCRNLSQHTSAPTPEGVTLLMDPGSYPYATYYNGKYYFIEMSTRTEGFLAISDMAVAPIILDVLFIAWTRMEYSCQFSLS